MKTPIKSKTTHYLFYFGFTLVLLCKTTNVVFFIFTPFASDLQKRTLLPLVCFAFAGKDNTFKNTPLLLLHAALVYGSGLLALAASSSTATRQARNTSAAWRRSFSWGG
jgi:hypothetical protein